MYKRPITYEDFNGNKVTETFHFHLSKAELVELELSYDDGFTATLQRIVETQDARSLVKEFKALILLAYGVRSEDGKRFIKNDQLREEFVQHPAYSALFMELATDEKAAGDFVTGIVPNDLADQMAPQDKPLAPPNTMSAPVPPGV
jgi:hypothetical protein